MWRPSPKLISMLTAAALAFSVAGTDLMVGTSFAEGQTAGGATAKLDSPLIKGSYAEYLSQYQDEPKATRDIVIEGEAFSKAEGMNVTVLDNYEGLQGKAIRTEESGSVAWSFDVEQEGLYEIGLHIYNVTGKDADIERELSIDGASPFSEAKSLVFHRIWKNASDEVMRDERGNDLPPDQVEVRMWQDVLLKDDSGYNLDPYLFYFSKGKHTIQLTSVREPLAIDSITLKKPSAPPTYDELANTYKEKGYEPAKDVMVKVQGEDATFKSSPSLQPYNDRSSPALEPFHVSKIRNNAMGGYGWRIPGQWIEWEVDVPEDGLYQIAFKNRQNYLRGFSALRTLTIDGELPFEEAKQIGFAYGSPWQMTVLGKDAENPYNFYLTKGTHRIRLEVALGDLANVLRSVQSSILDLNGMYRKIISFTGSSPDTFRDYHLEDRIPDMSEVFAEQSAQLYKVAAYIDGPGGKSSDRTAVLNSFAWQLKDMAERPDTVPSRLKQFKDNVGALGAWLLTTNEQPLTIDYVIVSSPNAKLPNPEATWFQDVKSSIQAFFASFYEKYDDYSSDSSDDNSISVWVTSGRDQAQIIKRLIDGSFTAKTGIHVDMKLVSSDVLLSATIAGAGPDVALPVTNDLPVNFASRSALEDLSKYPGFQDVAKRFNAESFVPYQYDGGIYALPNEQTFPVLFYRKDIIEDELHLKVPETWDELYGILPTLMKHNLQFGFAGLALPAGASAMPPNPAYSMMLMQNGGTFYTDDQMASALDNETAIQTFKQWTDFYVYYKTPVEFDFANRFRTGEMPIAIADYTEFNKLSVFAPEIKGLWDFALVPGVVSADGSLHREVAGSGSAAVMFEKTKNKDAAWQFLDWWTSKETQITFGRQIETRLGISGRYPTANLEALAQLPWPTRTYRTLQEQLEWLKGIPEVPGGYFTGRHLDNAFRRVINQGDDPRESLDYYIKYINDEITMKRKEFHLPYKK
ncbi:extracellular solute-binding protein [Paenibacillus thermotolerans]|uniref:extracellular solute-binding protein n=1 Tax=Paenibacillus thermotolerans TaxID=3027807 RepID=UPI0023684D12|nr:MULTISPECIES: extracellular solute-binding protein [unclassified Paenibacillus]